MIEADGVADLMRKGIAQVIDAETSVEADLPRLLWVEADERIGDDLLVALPVPGFKATLVKARPKG